MIIAGSAEVIKIRVEWVSGTLVQGQHAKDNLRKMRNRQGIQKSSLVEEESYMKETSLKHQLCYEGR